MDVQQEDDGIEHRTIRFSTKQLRQKDQFDAWQEVANPMLELSKVQKEKPGYIGETTSYNLSNFVFSSSNFEPMSYRVRAPGISRLNVDHWIVAVNRTGYSVSEINGTVVRVPRGGVAMRSLRKPISGEVAGGGMFLVYVPRDMFARKADAIDAFRCHSASDPFVMLLSDFLFSLERQLPQIREHQIPELCDAVKAMIGCCLAPSRDGIVGASEAISATLLERARRYIRSNVCSPSLSPDEVCRFLGVSRSSLYRLFEGKGGVAAEIREQRLLASHAALSDDRTRKTVYAVAEAYGFSSPEEFTKSFRRRFGYAPRDAHGLQLHQSKQYRASSVTDGSFGRWLLDLAP
ncbi:helix-turn-helix transcriptional regulator [Rhizobium sp. A37_96]